MILGTRLARPLVSAPGTLLALTLLAACPAHAAGPARRPAPAADSGAIESAPGKLLVPPAAPGTASSARPGIPPAGANAPEDTALASRRRRAREEFGRGLMLEEQHAY